MLGLERTDFPMPWGAQRNLTLHVSAIATAEVVGDARMGKASDLATCRPDYLTRRYHIDLVPVEVTDRSTVEGAVGEIHSVEASQGLRCAVQGEGQSTRYEDAARVAATKLDVGQDFGSLCFVLVRAKKSLTPQRCEVAKAPRNERLPLVPHGRHDGAMGW